jgi:hypothetical protein
MNDSQKQKLTKRFKQRQQEYGECVTKLKKQQETGVLKWHDNTFIVMKYPEQGYNRKFRGIWVPVCGDRDFFSMKCFKTGFELLDLAVCEKRYQAGTVSQAQYADRHHLDDLLQETWRLLSDSILMPQHGQHCAWEYQPAPSFEADINQTIVNSHSKVAAGDNAECLVQISPDLSIKAHYLDSQ